MKKVIIYSHGLGVKKDARGLFTALAKSLPEFENILFDYNQEVDGQLTLTPIDTQVTILNQQFDTVKNTYPDAEINLICHSQGCIIASKLQPRIHKALLLTPPQVFDFQQVSNIFTTREGTVIEENGDYILPRSDGSMTRAPHSYWESLKQLKDSPVDLYRAFAETTDTKIVRALEDEILGNTNFDNLKDVLTIDNIHSNHDLTNSAREEVITIAKRFFS